jgi:uncharacterized protein (TIGR02099 family)
MVSPPSPLPAAQAPRLPPHSPPRSSPRAWQRWTRLARAIGLALLLLWSLLLAAWLALHWAILPHIDEWRPRIERLASRSLGLPVTLGEIRVRSGGWVPAFELRELRVHDRDGREALYLQRVQAALAPRALLAATLRFEQIVIDGARLQARRDAQGGWHLAGLAWQGSLDGTDARARDWLLRQGEFVVRDAELHWTDERAAGAPLVLRELQFVLRNGVRSHALRLDATPPPQWGQRFSVRGRFTQPLLAPPGAVQRWSGTLYAQFAQADVAALRRQLDLPFELDEGDGALRAWVDIVEGKPRRATLDVALRALSMQLAPSLPPLRLQQVQGRLAASRDPGGIELRLHDVTSTGAAGLQRSIDDLRLRWQQAQDLHQPWTPDAPITGGELAIAQLDLAALHAWIDALPLPAPLRGTLVTMAPRGHAERLALRWAGTPEQPDSYRIEAKLRDLTLQPGLASAPGAPARPGVQAAQIELAANERGGQARLWMHSGALILPGVWQQPQLALDRLDAKLDWQITPRRGAPSAVELRLAKLSFANTDLRGEGSAVWRSGSGSNDSPDAHWPGRLELDARLQQVRAASVARYLPLGIDAAARDHVRDAVRAGTVRSARFKVDGELSRFPFRQPRDGEFLAVLQLHDIDYAFMPAPWPSVAQASGELEFNRMTMRLRRMQGRLGGYELRDVHGAIADLSADAPELQLQGQGQGNAADLLALARLAPLGSGMGAMLDPVSVDGPSTLSLALRVPLAGPQPLTLQGTARLAGAELRLRPELPPMLGVRGTLQVAAGALALQGVHASWLGGEVHFDASLAADGALQVAAQGSASADGLRQLPALAALAAPLHGQAAWRGTLGIGDAGVALTLHSDLAGMALDLPPPLAKPAASALPLQLQLSPLAEAAAPGQGRDRLEIQLGQAGELLNARFERETDAATGSTRVLRGRVAVRDALPPPGADGVHAALNLGRVDLDAWRALAARASAGDSGSFAAYAPRHIALRAEELRVAGRTLSRLQAVLDHERGTAAKLWRAQIASDQLAGDIEYREPAADPQAAQLSARLQRLVLQRASAGAADSLPGRTPPRLPGLDLVIDDFELHGRKLGRLQVAAVNRAGPTGRREWQLDRLELASPDAQLTASGHWGSTGARRTALDVKLQLRDGGRFAERLGAGNALRGGNGLIDGQLSWSGTPLAPDLASLDGRLRLDLGAGQFLHADPGGARLLGVFSLQALPRRLALDFRDLFQEGFAFDSVDGELTVARGVASTDNLRVRGAQATVLLQGQADLQRETQDLRVLVVPNFDAAGAALATMAINPAIGLGTLFAQWALREPLIAANTRELHVTGAWAEPRVQRIERPVPPDRADRGPANPTEPRPPG